MAVSNQLLVFALDERRYALPLAVAERVVAVAEISPLPKAPAIVLGIINVQGRIIPVVDVRKRFSLPAREAALTDQLILARTARRAVALMVDAVEGIVERQDVELTTAATILPGLEYVEGVAKLEGDLIFIHDLETFLSLEETKILDAALAPGADQ